MSTTRREARPTGTPPTGTPPTQLRTIVASSVVGTTVEWFDFFAYSTAAALVLNALFFPEYDPLVGTILAFGGIAVGYFGRPLGSIVFGHFGDRIGRKGVLVVSLVTMGAATFAIGLLPTYDAIGAAAPLILMALRFVQGFALGGEWGGAVLLVVEHAPEGRKAFLGSFPQVGLALGLTLSTLVFLPLVALPGEAFESWGWRLPFLVSAVLVLVGLFIRLRISETPEFEAVRRAGAEARVPLWETLRTHTAQVLLAALSFAVIGAVFYMLFTFSLTYGTEFIGHERSEMLTIATVCSAVALVGLPLAGRLADRFGVWRVFTGGTLISTALAFPAFWLIDGGGLAAAYVAYLATTIGFCATYGTLGVLYAQAFDVRIRYTGMSLALGIGTIAGSAFVPVIYLELLSTFGGSWAIALYMVVAGVVTLVASTLLQALNRRRQHTNEGAGA
ncbi:MFS transporter [Microbacterium marinilacus]|uniref:MFS transporter n=1 Tax=Microbacterium marinilacus TaxID=415209 RepID=A0ABP7BP82_9MICO|nr:MFS transporter [Microbacterium marinilacus]MBY0690252.1 MHS family MFS transporter [Microbacterium marinilacus]